MKKIKSSKKKKQLFQEVPIVRYQTDMDHGLSEEQIAERVEHKLTNDTKIRTSNSYLSIICKNTFTIFNLIWFMIAIALMCVNAWGDLLFLFVVFANTAISIFQEIKAKSTVEKLSMVTAPKVKVVRTGLTFEIKPDDLLLDDIIILENGNQIPADCIIVDGHVEANESLLTGESNSIKKAEGDLLLAGSFLVSGLCYARVDKVGKSNYIQTVAEKTKDFKPQTSNLFKDLNNLIKVIILILIPIGVMTFCKEMYLTLSTVEESITSTSGALTGMIPAGMYLLITVGLTVGVIKLGKKKTLVKNIYSIEMLARANVLCLDKTGTITDGTMNVVDVLPQNGFKKEKIEEQMRLILANQKTMNSTSVALVEHFGKTTNTDVSEVLEFSSQRKFSATTFKNGKCYYIGAVSFIKCPITAAQKKLMDERMQKGYRVIGLVEDENPYTEKSAGKRGKLMALFVLEDHIRKDAIETIKWFKDNDVQIKIISGDDALTVSKIAYRVGVENSDKYVSLENMSLQEVAQIANKFTVFGRVTPEQKHTIIKTLKTQGNVVAMTGDGVNDTLALKEANCSIAMADGSEAARNVSHLVLMESNFSALPAVVREGRQIVNNVQNSSVLYLMKTLFTIMLCVTTLVLRISYPFTPKQLLLLEMFVIGIPSFILTFQPNNELIRGNFIPQVLKKSIPCALLMFANILVVLIMANNSITLSEEEFTSLCTMLLTFVGFVNLVWICWPLNWLRAGCISISAVLIISAISGLGKFFSISSFSFPVLMTIVTLLVCTILVIVAVYYLKEWQAKRVAKFSEHGELPPEDEVANKFKAAFNKFCKKVFVQKPFKKEYSLDKNDVELPAEEKNVSEQNVSENEDTANVNQLLVSAAQSENSPENANAEKSKKPTAKRKQSKNFAENKKQLSKAEEEPQTENKTSQTKKNSSKTKKKDEEKQVVSKAEPDNQQNVSKENKIETKEQTSRTNLNNETKAKTSKTKRSKKAE